MNTSSAHTAKINVNPLKINPFVAEPRHIAKIEMSANAHRLIALICSEYGLGIQGRIEFTLERIAQYLGRSKRTACRIVAEIRQKGLIIARQTGRSLKFFLTDIVYGDTSKPRNHGPKSGRVAKNGLAESPLLASHIINKEAFKKEHTHPPKIPLPPEPIPPENNDLVYFENNLGADFGKIRTICDNIRRLPKKSGKAFNPWSVVSWSIRKNPNTRAIIDLLGIVQKRWDTITNPKKYYKKTYPKIAANYNEQDHIARAQAFKSDKQITSILKGLGL